MKKEPLPINLAINLNKKSHKSRAPGVGEGGGVGCSTLGGGA